jgi:hypothetical protein
MNGYLKTVLISAFCALLGAGVVALATQTNYLGTVFIADTTTPTNQLKVNSDGSINATVTGGGSTPGGTSGQIQYNNSGAFGGFTLGGDCTFSVPNITCTETNGTAFSALATLTPGSGVATALGNTAGGTGGFALQSSLGSYLPLAGGTMAGNIAMGGGNISGGGTITGTQFTSTIATGTAPFVVASTTNVANLNASSLNGNTFANPGAIGSGTAATSVAASGPISVALGTITTNIKGINITATWNAAGTTFDAPIFENITNTASANASLLADLQVGGTSEFKIDKSGNVTALGNYLGSGNIQAGASSFMYWTGRASLQSPADGNLLLQVNAGTNGVRFGVSATDGLLTLGTNAGGSNNALGSLNLTNLTASGTIAASGSGQITVAAMTQSAAAQSGTVCYNTSGGTITYDATLGCLTSLEEMKDIHGPITGALAEIEAFKPFWFSPINRPAGSDLAEQPGFGAHQIESVDKRLVGYGPDGQLLGVRYMEMTALEAAAITELKQKFDDYVKAHP